MHDIAVRTVPNRIAGALLMVGLALRLLDHTLLFGLFAALLVFLATAFCWRRRWMGGGDVKLWAAAALVVPPASTVVFVAAVTLAGGVLALFYLLGARCLRGQRTPRRTHRAGLLARAARAERWRIRRGGPLPYACAIAAGFLFVTL